ncbi:MAG: heme lyase NrfEFG subunit NrfE [Novosphingobium sp. 28-62-57]|uniref:heme lyase CcmF/NrfE family subunit n=1 Tax=unclassified Novosphingobium TaxID=2644732 RepID=UPI000BCFF19E|nr:MULTISPECIES: heme lyase CcmF/NrfE family subunit [unclassified Novosphingobium]OYW48830.1 MAG: heme lyase NrfEFG subunit NrfE [Novosphingobium sp. 12-62-10]OYZ12013.1 MAG: heme lyase NrfEFG subunit NrfE [Novosphingobium sp. 28-62-57]OZA33780.1 MAG: heme lyase NrfEFG subunit NrfE [Novosphingobium sp. 17-62-9]
MIAEIGLAVLWMAAALAVLQLFAGFSALRPSGQVLVGVVRPLAVIQGLLVGISFLCLISLFLETDLSVKLVAANSHSMKPFIFKLAGTWGNHEGSMLLWITVMAISGGVVALVEKRLREDTLIATLAGQAFVSLGFYAFLLLSSNPFERLPEPAPEGQGLNPLLQDVGLAFHPPTLYVGYVGLSVAFSFAIGALITRDVGPAFARAMRPWVLGAWIFLTIGITAGSYWAYYTLGWGGWWFWDPVENASLMPWLAATALLHSSSVLASRNALRAWTVMLGVIAFSMSMVGTFLVRSGILTSVHAFAVDPERGSFILALLAIYIGGALALFGIRASTVTEGERFSLFSREASLVFNNVMLCGILGIVLLGTLYPLMTEAFDAKVSVGPPYFNPVSAIFAIPMMLMMGVGPLLRWRKDKPSRITATVAIPALVVALVLLGVVLMFPSIRILPMLGLAVGIGLAVGSWLPLKGRNLRRTPLAVWGMVLAHCGLGVALFGAASESAFSIERLAAMTVGDTQQVGPITVKLEGMGPIAGPNWTAIEATISASYNGGTPVMLRPQARTFTSPPGERTESALHTRWNGQLYAVLGNEGDDGRWQMRFWWKPFVPLIWLGGLLVAFGGLVALLGRVAQDVKRVRATDKIAFRKAQQDMLK